jgi:hypothetical protein
MQRERGEKLDYSSDNLKQPQSYYNFMDGEKK